MMLLMFDHSAIAMAQIPLRGVVEGFYGKPWTQEECLSQFCFYGEKGLNAYIYAPVVPEGISIQDMQMVSEIYGRRMWVWLEIKGNVKFEISWLKKSFIHLEEASKELLEALPQEKLDECKPQLQLLAMTAVADHRAIAMVLSQKSFYHVLYPFCMSQKFGKSRVWKPSFCRNFIF